MRLLVRLVLALVVGAAGLGTGAPDAPAQTRGYDAPTSALVGVHAIRSVEAGPILFADARKGSATPSVESGGMSSTPPAPVVATSTAGLTKYDPDFALGQITSGGRATASQLDEFGRSQGWIRSQTATGPIKYTDANGVVRVTIKKGSPRAPGSGSPHVEMRNAEGVRIDPYGNPVTRTSPGNHTPIEWDLEP
jgi:hypothetical protein